MRKILLTGVSGFLGGNFCHFHEDEYDIHAIYNEHPVSFKNVNAHQLNLLKEDSVKALIDSIKPDAIIHLAALSQPNDCARQPELSFRINVEASELLATYAHHFRIPFLFASSDLIFDGEDAPYAEDSIPRPMNLYGEHKAEAEKRVMKADPGAFICRLPLMYGSSYSYGVSFLQPWLNDLKAGKPVNLFIDEFRTPASAKDVCRGLITVLEKGKPGIYNFGGPERLSRVEMGERIADVFGLDKSLLHSRLRADVPMPAYRPKDISLSSDKMKKLGWEANALKDELRELIIQNS